MLLSIEAFPQTNVWYFGQNAGIEFPNSGAPLPLLNGNMNTPEGCATIMDGFGSIANYTNGEQLWIGGSSTIINGLKGDKQATQSSIFLRKPLDKDTVYLFTLDAGAGPDGLNYSVIVNQNIVPGMKNIPMQPNVTERMCIVEHCNNLDAWLIVHGWNDNKFYAYRITGEGVDSVPVVSTTGSIHSGNILNATGYLKANQLGDKLALAKMGSGSVELFKFDNVNGVVSNALILNNLSTPYGIEFNALGNRLFVSTASGSLYNYDITYWNASDIHNSRQLISSSNNLLGALQIGPNDKIYVAQDNSQFLGQISAPNNLGPNCIYNPQAIYLEGFTCEAGLPPYSENNQGFKPTVTVSCFGSPNYFNILGDTFRIDSLIWDFGDPTTNLDVSYSITPSYTFPGKGLYPCSLLIYHCDVVDTFEVLTQVVGAPEINLGKDTSICENQNFQLNVNPKLGIFYEWQDGSKGFVFPVTKKGKYWVKAYSACGMASDTIEILNVWPSPQVNLPSDSTLCQGDSLILDGGSSFLCIWENTDTNRYFVVRDTGEYHLQVYDTNSCSGEGSFNLRLDYLPKSNLGNDTTLCYGDYIELRAGKAQFYQWHNMSTSPNFTTMKAGVYSVEMTNHCGSIYDSIQVELIDCDVDMHIPNAFTPNGDYLNDVFLPIAVNVVGFDMKIYTKLGQQIFETQDYALGWDGRINGAYVESGAYFYVIHYKGESGRVYLRKGFVSVIR